MTWNSDGIYDYRCLALSNQCLGLRVGRVQVTSKKAMSISREV
jgi:hypothetical protein